MLLAVVLSVGAIYALIPIIIILILISAAVGIRGGKNFLELIGFGTIIGAAGRIGAGGVGKGTSTGKYGSGSFSKIGANINKSTLGTYKASKKAKEARGKTNMKAEDVINDMANIQNIQNQIDVLNDRIDRVSAAGGSTALDKLERQKLQQELETAFAKFGVKPGEKSERMDELTGFLPGTVKASKKSVQRAGEVKLEESSEYQKILHPAEASYVTGSSKSKKMVANPYRTKEVEDKINEINGKISDANEKIANTHRRIAEVKEEKESAIARGMGTSLHTMELQKLQTDLENNTKELESHTKELQEVGSKYPTHIPSTKLSVHTPRISKPVVRLLSMRSDKNLQPTERQKAEQDELFGRVKDKQEEIRKKKAKGQDTKKEEKELDSLNRMLDNSISTLRARALEQKMIKRIKAKDSANKAADAANAKVVVEEHRRIAGSAAHRFVMREARRRQFEDQAAKPGGITREMYGKHTTGGPLRSTGQWYKNVLGVVGPGSQIRAAKKKKRIMGKEGVVEALGGENWRHETNAQVLEARAKARKRRSTPRSP